MKSNMSLAEMLSSFIFITKGSRVVDRTASVDWDTLRWMSNAFAKDKLYSLADLKRHFAYGPRGSKWNRTPLEEWLAHPMRMTASSPFDAMTIAHEIARGLVEPPVVRLPADAPEWMKRHSRPSDVGPDVP